MISRIVRYVRGALVRKIVVVVVAVYVLLTLALVEEMVRNYGGLLHARLIARAQSNVSLLRESVLPQVRGHDLIALDNLLQWSRRLPDVDSIEVVDEYGKVLGHTDPSKVGRFAVDGRMKSLLSAPIDDKQDHSIVLQDSDDLIEAGAPLDLLGHRLGALRISLGTRATVDMARTMAAKAIAFGLLAIVVGAFITSMVARRLSRRLTRLMGEVDSYLAGGAADPGSDGSPDEVGRLAQVLAQFMAEITASRQRILADRDHLDGLVKQRTEELQFTARQAIESRIFVEKIIANSPYGIAVAESSGHCVLVNQAALTMLAMSDLELSQRSLDETAFFGDPLVAAAAAAARTGGQTTTCTVERRRQEADPQTLHCSFTPFESQERQFLLCKFEDITDRKAAELKLAEVTSRFGAIFMQTQDGISFVDLSGRYVMVNPAFCSMVGYSEPELLGLTVRDVSAPHTSPSLFEQLAKAGGSSASERELRRKDGTIFWAQISGSRIRVGDRDYVQGLVRDISERKRAEALLRENEERFRAIFTNSPDPYLVVDAETAELQNCNPATETMMGLSWAELIGKTVGALAPQYQHDGRLSSAVFAERLKMAQDEGRDRFECQVSRGDQTKLWVDINASAVVMNGRPVLLLVWRDISVRKVLEESLQRSNQELEQFAYVASHDLQEPLRMVASYTELLSERYKGRLDERADKFIDYAVDGAKRMQGLINDLLEFSRVGSRAEARELVPATAALTEALANLQFALRDSQGVVTHTELPMVWATGTQLVLLFQNLVGNALKFRGALAPTVHLSAEARAGEWLFCVRDNGIGIDPQFAERIFRVFQRLHERGKYPGSGIGLAICKKIVTRHGGRMWVESQPGQGAAFFFTWPMQALGAERVLARQA